MEIKIELDIKDFILLCENTDSEKIYNLNQNLNFENWEDSSLYNTKLTTRQLVIDNTTDTQTKQNMIKYSMYDLENLINSKINTDLIKDSLNFLETNKSYIDFKSQLTINKYPLPLLLSSQKTTAIEPNNRNIGRFGTKIVPHD